jgi:hypothetical protein
MRILSKVAAALSMPAILIAQGATESPRLDFSGVLFLNFQTRTDSAARFTTGGEPASKFDVERAYLIFRMPAGNRGSIRVTTDVFQNTSAGYYSGWTARLKHAYFQYEISRNLAGVQGLGLQGRFGMLHTVVIDHIEAHWPRYLGITAVERAGFFSSADAGAVALLTFPGQRGEAYLTITNGPGYTSAETDRFKDFAGRVTFTPLASGTGLLRTLAITPWYYKGWSASAFTAPPNSVSDGLRKDRRGVFVGLRDRRLTVGADFAQRIEDVESAPLTVRTRTGTLVSAFGIVRPLELLDPANRSPFGIVARHDRFDLDDASDQVARFTVVGLTYDVTQRATATLDYQELSPTGSPRPGTPTRTWFLHWQVGF